MKCRHCGADLSIRFVDLGTAPPSNAYLTSDKLSTPEKWFPLKVMVCSSCWLVQTEDHPDSVELFSPDYAYFSSYSSRPDALSEYVQIKYRIEQYFLQNGYTVVRPGLVIGKGGMFLKMLDAVRKSPVIPLPDGGNSEVPIVSVRQLCEALHKIISSSIPEQEFNLFYPEMTTMRALTNAMKIAIGSSAAIVPFPSSILKWAAILAKKFRIKLPFNPDSAKSYKSNLIRLHNSSIGTLLERFDSVQEAVNVAVSD